MRWLIPSLYERRARETNNPRLPAVAFIRYQERIPERIQPISKWIELIYGLCGPASRPDCKLNRNREPLPNATCVYTPIYRSLVRILSRTHCHRNINRNLCVTNYRFDRNSIGNNLYQCSDQNQYFVKYMMKF